MLDAIKWSVFFKVWLGWNRFYMMKNNVRMSKYAFLHMRDLTC